MRPVLRNGRDGKSHGEKETAMDYQMIVLDLDGTLTNRDKEVTERTRQALMEAQRRGKRVVLASGRPTYGVLPLAELLRLDQYGGYILSFNGGFIMDCSTREVIFQKFLPKEVNRQVIELVIKEQVDLLTYQDQYLITNHPESSYVQLESRVSHLMVRRPENLVDYVDFAVPKFLLAEDGRYLALVEGRVKAALGKQFSIYRSDPFFLEILPRGIDKAQCLEYLLDHIGMKREQMIACGDGYNDQSMIRFAGLGVAMANAVLPVRKAADYVTFSNDEDGVAHVVEKFLL